MPCQLIAQPPTTVTFSCEDIEDQNNLFSDWFYFFPLFYLKGRHQLRFFRSPPSIRMVPTIFFPPSVFHIYSLGKRSYYSWTAVHNQKFENKRGKKKKERNAHGERFHRIIILSVSTLNQFHVVLYS